MILMTFWIFASQKIEKQRTCWLKKNIFLTVPSAIRLTGLKVKYICWPEVPFAQHLASSSSGDRDVSCHWAESVGCEGGVSPKKGFFLVDLQRRTRKPHNGIIKNSHNQEAD